MYNINNGIDISEKMSEKRFKQIKELEANLEIFANERRLAILSYLKIKKAASVGDIADNIKISFKAASKHLLYLAGKGILIRRYDGPFVLYKVSSNLPQFTRLIISELM
jgi:DNA-binding transcriptional ArsR family regulator